MLYQTYQTQLDLTRPMRRAARLGRDWLALLPGGLQSSLAVRHLSAAWELLGETRLTHHRPDFNINRVTVDDVEHAVAENPVFETAFGTLLHFEVQGLASRPKVLLVSPMAGHFATLLRDTIITLLPDHDVYVTDWHNIRDVPLSAGPFDLDSYIEHLIQFLEHIGPGAHLMGICQPCPAALVTVALMAEDQHPATPRSLTLMAGPVDTRINPTSVNKSADKYSLRRFERTVIDRVPRRYAGAGRRVYPGFVQIGSFMSMNLPRHQDAFYKRYKARAAGDHEAAEEIREFYSEYLAVCDLPAEFYLQTLRVIFKEHHLPRGQFDWRGRRVKLDAIHDTALFVVEGGRDDICGAGQTSAALALCGSLPDEHKSQWVEPEAGHYGVFSGRRWRQSVYPRLRDWIARHDGPQSAPDARIADETPPQPKALSEAPSARPRRKPKKASKAPPPDATG